MPVRSGLRRDLVGGPAPDDDFHQDLLPQSTISKAVPTTPAITAIAMPTFAPVLNPFSSGFAPLLSEGDSVDIAVGSDVEEETADVGVELSDDGVTVITVYDADEVDGVPPPRAPVAVLGTAGSAEVWLHSPSPPESV